MRNPGNKRLSHILAGLLLAGAAQMTIGQTPDLNVNQFDTDTSVNGFWDWWGAITNTWEWDSTHDAGGSTNAGSGSAKLTIVFDNNSSDNQYCYGMSLSGQGSYNSAVVANPNAYSALEFDILWDNNNTVTVGQFNNPPAGGDAGFSMGLAGVFPSPGVAPSWDGGQISWIIPGPTLTNNGSWQHISIPLDATRPGFAALVFKKWNPGGGNTNALNGTANVWIDNIKLIGTEGPPPAPTLSLKKSDAVGLKLTTSASGQYQRQSIAATSTEAQSTWWVDNPNPVTYLLTIADMPLADSFQAHIFLSPDSGGANSPDWNDPNVIFLDIHRNADGSANASFRSKTNEAGGNTMLYGSGTLAELGSSTALGTWSMEFANNTDVTLTGPDGSTTNISLPSGYVDAFRPTTSMTASFGVQPNDTALIGLSAVFSHITIKNGTTAVVDDSFDQVYPTTGGLNTNLWTIRADDPNGIRVFLNKGYLVSWAIPDTGYSLLVSSNLNSGWYDLPIPLSLGAGIRSGLVGGADLPAGQAYFRLIQRTATKLQVLVPGESNAPNTASGKTGTPSSQSAGVLVPITINAVDDTWHVIGGYAATVTITSSDVIATTPGVPTGVPFDAPLIDGTLTTNIYFWSGGSTTVTATNDTLGSATSSAFNVQQ